MIDINIPVEKLTFNGHEMELKGGEPSFSVSTVFINGMTNIDEPLVLDTYITFNVIIGNSVTSIGDYAFREWGSATSLTIGNSVTSIGDYAFGKWYSLEYAECLALTPPQIERLSFGDHGTYYIHLPAESEALYQVATNWSDLYAQGRLIFDL